jgi:hypothetical protein
MLHSSVSSVRSYVCTEFASDTDLCQRRDPHVMWIVSSSAEIVQGKNATDLEIHMACGCQGRRELGHGRDGRHRRLPQPGGLGFRYFCN